MKIIELIIVVAIISILIYIIKNQKSIKESINKIDKQNNKFKILILLTKILLIFMFLFMLYFYIKQINENIELYIKAKEDNKIFEDADNKILEENIFFNDAMSKEYISQKYNEPYIPNGFKYVEGTYDAGFVIEDEDKNQYVWVPCSNNDIDGILKLQRKDFVEKAFISKNSCYNEEYKEFIVSALENGGFYISRYEIGIENSKPVSKSGVEVWQNVNRNEAIKIIKDMYSKETINCSLINGYAYDTTLNWINNTNEIKIDYLNISENAKIVSGRNEYNKIYDFIDNVMELTLETSYDTVIIRGFLSYSGEILGYDNAFNHESRYSIQKEDNYVGLSDALSLRTVLYK